MRETANVNDAIEEIAGKIRHINVLHSRLRDAAVEGNERRFEMFEYRVEHAVLRYYGTVNALASVFDASFDELEHMALEHMGYGYFDTAEAFWSHTLSYGE